MSCSEISSWDKWENLAVCPQTPEYLPIRCCSRQSFFLSLLSVKFRDLYFMQVGKPACRVGKPLAVRCSTEGHKPPSRWQWQPWEHLDILGVVWEPLPPHVSSQMVARGSCFPPSN